MQRGLCLEEPDAGNLLVRVCGGADWVTSGPTRKVEAYKKVDLFQIQKVNL
jgi:hypothetical protein